MEPVSFSLLSDHAGTRKNYLLVKVELYKVARLRKLALEMQETRKALSAQQGGSADRKGSHQTPHPAGEPDILAFFCKFLFFFFPAHPSVWPVHKQKVEIILEKTSLQFWAVPLFPTEKTDWTRRLGVLNLLVLRVFLSAYVLSRPYFSAIQGSRGVEMMEGGFLAQFAA